MEYRGYNIDGDKTYGYKLIKSIKPGSVPGALRGSFTTAAFAQRQIDIYLSTKEIKDGKAVSNA